MHQREIIRYQIQNGQIELAIEKADKDQDLLFFALDCLFQMNETNFKNGLLIVDRIVNLTNENIKAITSKLIFEGKIIEAVESARNSTMIDDDKINLLCHEYMLCRKINPQSKVYIVNSILEIDPQNLRAIISRLIFQNNINEVIGRDEIQVPLLLFAWSEIYQGGNIEQKMLIINRILDINPQNSKALLLHGRILSKQNRFSEAESKYNQALNNSNNEERSEILNSLAQMFEKINRFEDAQSKFIETVKNNPNDIKARENQGDLLFKLGKFSEAEIEYRDILEFDSDFLSIQLKLGDTLYKLTRYEESKEHYNYAIEKYEMILKRYDITEKANEAIDQTRAEIYDGRKKWAEEKLASLYDHLGKVQIKLKEYNEAKCSLENAIKLNKYHAGAYNNIGVLLKEKGDAEKNEEKKKKLYEDSRENFLQSLSIFKGNFFQSRERSLSKHTKMIATVNNNLGIVSKNLNENIDSEEYFKTAIRIKPDFVDAYVNLGVLLVNEERCNDAIKNFETALILDPSSFKANYNLISTNSKKENNITWLESVTWNIIAKLILPIVLFVLIITSLYALIEPILLGYEKVTEIETNTTIGLSSNITTITTTTNDFNFNQATIFIFIIIFVLLLPDLLTRITALKLSTSGVECEMESPKESDSDILNTDSSTVL